MSGMFVVKRDGTSQNVSFDKVLYRIKGVCKDLPVLQNVKAELIAQKVIDRIYDGISTSELDLIAADICQPMVTEHLEYEDLASRLLISNHHKNTIQQPFWCY
jgi:ribonucleoside-diphosphate reductase alpha chain